METVESVVYYIEKELDTSLRQYMEISEVDVRQYYEGMIDAYIETIAKITGDDIGVILNDATSRIAVAVAKEKA